VSDDVGRELPGLFGLAMDMGKEGLGCFRVREQVLVLGYKSINGIDEAEERRRLVN
jgi:hypothetical protein